MVHPVRYYCLLFFVTLLPFFNQCWANSITTREDDWQQEWDDPSTNELDITAFIEIGQGEFTANNVTDKGQSLQEIRGHVEVSTYLDDIYISFKGDVVVDGVIDDTVWDTREAILSYTPIDFLDVKIGRQVLTWGTGDQVFLNDTFAKDWQSLFSGRDVKYLKVPTDALRLSYFDELFNADLIWITKYQADKFISGQRFSYYSTAQQVITAQPLSLNKPSDDEFALRLYRDIAGYEVAIYGSSGYYTEPAGFDAENNQLYFPRFASYGASIRGTLSSGVANLEVSQYLSLDDKHGTNPLVKNSEFRLLLGYEQELLSKLNIGLQYYLEHLNKYDQLLANLPLDEVTAEQNRHVFTLRLAYQLMQDKLTLSLFTMVSPNENDSYLASRIAYRPNDHYNWEIGSRTFTGKKPTTFFGQFRENDNIYMRLRYSF